MSTEPAKTSNDIVRRARAALRREARAINEQNRVPGDLYYKEPVSRTPAATREEWYQGDEAAQMQETAKILYRHRASAIIQCAECDNQVSVDQFTEQELLEDGWLLEPVVYCPVHGPDDGTKENNDEP